MEAERKRQSELSRKLSEANERIEELENEAANDRNDLIDGEQIKEELKDQNEKHQDVILKLYKLVDEEKNQRKQAESVHHYLFLYSPIINPLHATALFLYP